MKKPAHAPFQVGFKSPSARKKVAMPSHMAHIERSNRKEIKRVEVQVTVTELSGGRQSWSGEFLSPSADGILPNERLSLTLDTGQKGTARVMETEFNSRTPSATLIHFTGTGPLI